MKTKAIIVGSAPVSKSLETRDLDDYFTVALNHAWKLRPDFNAHVFLDSLPNIHRPPEGYPAASISRQRVMGGITNAGGIYLTGMTAATSAGYWSIHNRPQRTFSYFGCDMVYSDTDANHFYGSFGDAGPMLGTFIHNAHYPAKYARLFVYGLLNRKLFLNASGLDGTQLSLPIVPLGQEHTDLCEQVMNHPIAHDILRCGLDAILYEQSVKTPIFNRRLLVFNKDPQAAIILDHIANQWQPVVDLLLGFQAHVDTMIG